MPNPSPYKIGFSGLAIETDSAGDPKSIDQFYPVTSKIKTSIEPQPII